MRTQGSIIVLALTAVLLAGMASTAAEDVPAAAPPAESENQSFDPPPALPPPAPKPKLMDINSASVEQLMTLPGMNERLAFQVVAGRPYRSRVDLKTRKVVPTPVFNAIVERIVAKSPKLTAK